MARRFPPGWFRWVEMRNRCHNPNRKDFARYGGRGITVCDRWRSSFDAFVEDMGLPPPGYSLDRIDNNGPYSPENCRWATREEQARNQTTNVFAEVDGERLTLSEWARKLGVSKQAMRYRAALLGSHEAAIRSIQTQPLRLGAERIRHAPTF